MVLTFFLNRSLLVTIFFYISLDRLFLYLVLLWSYTFFLGLRKVTKSMINKKSKIFKGDIYCDEKGLIFEAYNIENIDASSCRTIFFDWIISLDPSVNQGDAINELLETYSSRFPNHPMTKLLMEGLTQNIAKRYRKRAKNAKELFNKNRS